MSDGDSILVEICNQQSHLAIDEAFFNEVAQYTFSHQQITTAEISIAVVDNDTIHELNRQHLNHDYATDVLSFLLSDEGTTPIEGEIIISAEMATETADGYQWSPHSELLLYLIHGILHLCGHDDHSEEDRSKMRSCEKEILGNWNLEPQYRSREE